MAEGFGYGDWSEAGVLAGRRGGVCVGAVQARRGLQTALGCGCEASGDVVGRGVVEQGRTPSASGLRRSNQEKFLGIEAVRVVMWGPLCTRSDDGSGRA